VRSVQWLKGIASSNSRRLGQIGHVTKVITGLSASNVFELKNQVREQEQAAENVSNLLWVFWRIATAKRAQDNKGLYCG
jgi:hypothetical protein